MSKKKAKNREFFATSWAIDNKTSVYVLTVLISIIGFMSYKSIPKEQMPEVVLPTVLVSTIYPGTSPQDIENLVTRPIEKQIKSITGVKKMSSNSIQDFSSVVVEFNPNVDVQEAKDKVKEAVDKAKSELPKDLLTEPNIMDIDLSEIPIMYLNLSGKYNLEQLKTYGELLQDRIESLPEITRVDIVGALDREIQIDVDLHMMKAAGLSFTDIERAVASENATISIGTIKQDGIKRSISVKGQLPDLETLGDVILQTPTGGKMFLRDIAEIKDSYKEQESFASYNGETVLTLNIIKKSGANLLDASDKIKDIVTELKASSFPTDLNVNLTGDQSRFTRNTLEELNNTIIIGFILVIIVLMFFMGLNNSFFVALSVPLSMMVSYMVLPGIGFTMNMIVMFAFIFALGIIVDDAIVVIENTHRVHRKIPDITKAAKYAAGEVFFPILSGTLTTLAPFFPLAFWPGIVGQFMHYMPVTIIIALFASLLVAYIMNPVFAVSFMKHEYDSKPKVFTRRNFITYTIVLLLPALLFHLAGWRGMGNFMIIAYALTLLFQFFIKKAILYFQNHLWPAFLRMYENALINTLKGKRPYWVMGTVIGLFLFSIILTGIAKPKVIFFPDNEPNMINVLVKMPVGTDVIVTDSIARIIESRVTEVVGKGNPDVESIQTNVAMGADPNSFDRSISPEKAKITVNFIEGKFRIGPNTNTYLEKIRESLKDIVGAQITVEKNRMGPPTGKPISLEFYSENLESLVNDTRNFERYLDSINIPGIEEIKSDLQESKPEIIVVVDRMKANAEGLSTAQIGMVLRTAIYGKEISKYKIDEDEFPIQLRFADKYRNDIAQIMNMNITFRDMASGRIKDVPVSAVASLEYGNSYGGIRRVDSKRAITLSSEVLSGHNANDIINRLGVTLKGYHLSPGTTYKFTGEQESQKESMGFLTKAMIISLGLIFFILIAQFNSIGKSLIILSEVLFSIIGVLLGVVIFGMSISVIMTGIGIVALGGIVVRNGILIVEFADKLKAQGMKTREAIIEAGKTRITPVVLTATATMLGLIPLAVGMNINFETLLTDWNPQIYFGGDNVMFWGSLSWTIVFGLAFATFLTLLFIPAMYLIHYALKVKIKRIRSNRISVKIEHISA